MTTTYGNYVPIERTERHGSPFLKGLAEVALVLVAGYGVIQGGRYFLNIFCHNQLADQRSRALDNIQRSVGDTSEDIKRKNKEALELNSKLVKSLSNFN